MTPELEQFLSKIRENLCLPDAQAEPIMAELRLHLQSDFEERLSSGLTAEAAAQETMGEFGEAQAVARELQEEHKIESRGRAMIRDIGAGLLALFGFFTIQVIYGISPLMHFLEQFFPRNPNGILLITGWLQPLYSGLDWNGQHLSDVQQLLLLQAIPLVALGLLVGVLTRKRLWLLALAPWLLFWAPTWQAVARGKFHSSYPIHFVEPVAQALFILLGVYLGRQFANWRSGVRGTVTGLGILMLAAVGIIVFSQTLEGNSIIAAFLLASVGLAALVIWGALRLLDRWGKRQQAKIAK